jgi:hypothetical protein
MFCFRKNTKAIAFEEFILSGNIHREDSYWKSQVSIAFHCCFTEKCCSLLRLTTLLYNRLNYVIKVNYFLRLFNYFLTAVSANYVFIQPAPGFWASTLDITNDRSLVLNPSTNELYRVRCPKSWYLPKYLASPYYCMYCLKHEQECCMIKLLNDQTA